MLVYLPDVRLQMLWSQCMESVEWRQQRQSLVSRRHEQKVCYIFLSSLVIVVIIYVTQFLNLTLPQTVCIQENENSAKNREFGAVSGFPCSLGRVTWTVFTEDRQRLLCMCKQVYTCTDTHMHAHMHKDMEQQNLLPYDTEGISVEVLWRDREDISK